jgi:hypothetical protein
MPNYQKGVSMTANQGSLTNRNIPDVAAVADSIWQVANNNEFLISVGTSAAAPLWAGFAALVNQQAVVSGKPPIGFVNPALYGIGKEVGYAAKFHDREQHQQQQREQVPGRPRFRSLHGLGHAKWKQSHFRLVGASQPAANHAR